MTESSFLTIERLGVDEVWLPVATDANWETKYVHFSNSNLKINKFIEMKFLLQNNAKINGIKFLYIVTLILRLNTFFKKKPPISLNKIIISCTL